MGFTFLICKVEYYIFIYIHKYNNIQSISNIIYAKKKHQTKHSFQSEVRADFSRALEHFKTSLRTEKNHPPRRRAPLQRLRRAGGCRRAAAPSLRLMALQYGARANESLFVRMTEDSIPRHGGR